MHPFLLTNPTEASKSQKNDSKFSTKTMPMTFQNLNMPPPSGHIQVLIQVDKCDYFKKWSWHWKNSFCFGFLWISLKRLEGKVRKCVFFYSKVKVCSSTYVNFFTGITESRKTFSQCCQCSTDHNELFGFHLKLLVSL